MMNRSRGDAVQRLANVLSAAEESGRDVFPISDDLARDLIIEVERLAVALDDAAEAVAQNWSIDAENARLREEIERLGRCNQHISHTFSAIINQHLHDLVKQNAEIMRLRAELERLQSFRDAVYGSIIENAGAQSPFSYIWQGRWDEIKADEKGKP